MEVQHIRRDPDNPGHLLDQEVLRRVAMVMLDRIQIRRVDGTAVLTLKLGRQIALTDAGLLTSFLSTWPKVFIIASLSRRKANGPLCPQAANQPLRRGHQNHNSVIFKLR
jgi:hypothetical protein